jgi:drug/metabolite transporter (DMT)-like permease
LAIVIALAGVALISLEGLRHNVGASPMQWLGGIAALIAAAVTWAFYSLFLRVITRKQSSLTATGISNGLILTGLLVSMGRSWVNTL